MTALLKSIIVDKFRKGYSILDLATEYGYNEQQIRNIINPNAGKHLVLSKVTTTKVSTDEAKQLSKKIRQKEAGKKAAETRMKNKQQLAKVIPITTVVKEKDKLQLLREFTDTLYKLGELLLTK